MRVNILRKTVRKWAYENIVGKKVYNKDLKNYIHFTKRGIKHDTSFSNKNYIPKLLSIYSLENIVKTAEYLRTEKDKKNRKHIKAILILKNITEVNDIKYNIEVIIRETNEGRLFYDHTLLDIKKKAENV